jgi:hypothetical protein
MTSSSGDEAASLQLLLVLLDARYSPNITMPHLIALTRRTCSTGVSTLMGEPTLTAAQ